MEQKKIYIIGIEGAGTSALASFYVQLGYLVSGSDNGDHFYGDVLKSKNIPVFHHFSVSNLPEKVDWVVYSTAYKNDNPEIEAAKKRGLKALSYPEALGELTREKFSLAVSGTHGKTTTTALLATALKTAGADPSAIVGSKVIDWNANSLVGAGKFLVFEADEYQNKLKYYQPLGVILTSVDYDHPDFFKNFQEYKNVFRDFVSRIPKYGFLVYCADDRDVDEIATVASCQKFSYGFHRDSDFRIENLQSQGSGKETRQFFTVVYRGKSLGEFEIQLFGRHNVSNATAVIAIGYKLGLDLYKVKKGLKKFSGVARRFEYLGERNKAIIIDDYAHHPEEIKAVLKTARKLYSHKNIRVLFHPHSFSRTEALLENFAQSFSDADEVFVLDIYGSAREKEGKVSSSDLVSAINKYYPDRAEYLHDIEEAVKFLRDKLNGEDVLFTMGAGDVWKAGKILANKD